MPLLQPLIVLPAGELRPRLTTHRGRGRWPPSGLYPGPVRVAWKGLEERELGPARGRGVQDPEEQKGAVEGVHWEDRSPLACGAAGGGVPRLQSPLGWRQRPCVGLRHPVIMAGHSRPALEVAVARPGPPSLKHIPPRPHTCRQPSPWPPHLTPCPLRTTEALGRAAPAWPLPGDSGRPAAPAVRMR